MLGIVIGVFGGTFQSSITGSIGEIGNRIVLSSATVAGIDSLTERNLREIARVVDDAGAGPIGQDRDNTSGRAREERVTIYEMDAPGGAYSARSGRIPPTLRSGALVGAGLADEFEIDDGDSITVEDQTYPVHAILDAQRQFSPIDPDTAVILSVRDVEGDGYTQIVVTAGSGEAANETAMAIRGALTDRKTRVSIFEFGQIVAQIGSVFDAVNLFLVGIGSISLLVAGVSTLNVMLNSTIERREEVGVLRAVGYQRRDVLRIILSEAVLLGRSEA